MIRIEPVGGACVRGDRTQRRIDGGVPRRGPARCIGFVCGSMSMLGFIAPGFGQTTAPPAIQPNPPAPDTAVPSEGGPTGLNERLASIGFHLTPFFDIGETYNDNVHLVARGSETSDFITALSPGFDITENSRRVQGRLVYNPQELIFARGTSSNTLQQRLLGTGHADLYQEMAFLDSSASIQQAFLSNTGAIGPTTLTSSGNLQTVKAANASPYLMEHLAQYADSETRYRFSYIETSGGQIAPEHINEALQRFTGGKFFGRLGWTLTGDWTRIDRGSGTSDPFGGTSSRDEVARADLQYPVIYSISVVGGVGYERIADPSLIVQPNGLIWNAGLQYQPNQTVFASLTYGRRFEQTDVEFHASYALTPGLRIHALYTQLVQTSQSQIASNLGQTTLGPNGAFINPQTGLPVTVNGNAFPTTSSAFGISSGSFLDKRYEADVEATRGRNNYFFSAYDEKRSGQTLGTSNERILGTTLSWIRQLWPNLSSNVTGGYSRSLFQDGSGRVDNLYTVSFGLAYAISPTATTNLAATRYDRRSNFAAESLVNDVVTISLHKEF